MKKIIWAVDALAEDKNLQKNVLKSLEAITKDRSVRIEPVYVFSEEMMPVTSVFFPIPADEIRKAARNGLEKWLGKIKSPNLSKAIILEAPDHSLRSAVATLLSYAKEQGADLIAVSTLAKKGVTRFLMGSFAETLILHSSIPVFVVSPKTKIKSKITEILYPTDLSDKSKAVLNKVVQLATELKAKITLFHHVDYINAANLDPFVQNPAYSKYLDEDVKARKKTVEGWIKEISSRGVVVKAIINTKGLFTAEAILAQAKGKSGMMIAMSSNRGPAASALLGSVARQVLRVAQSPVWAIHPVEENQNKTSTEGMRAKTARLGVL